VHTTVTGWACPGGQAGNTNALKHGFYAREFEPNQLEDYDRARSLTGFDEEIALLRLVILNLAETSILNTER